MQKLVEQFFTALEAQVCTTDHQKRSHGPRQECADEQGCWHEDGLVEQRAFGHGHDNGQFAIGVHSRQLLGIESQIVSQDAGRFLHSHFAEHGHIIQQRSDIIDQS